MSLSLKIGILKILITGIRMVEKLKMIDLILALLKINKHTLVLP